MRLFGWLAGWPRRAAPPPASCWLQARLCGPCFWRFCSTRTDGLGGLCVAWHGVASVAASRWLGLTGVTVGWLTGHAWLACLLASDDSRTAAAAASVIAGACFHMVYLILCLFDSVRVCERVSVWESCVWGAGWMDRLEACILK
ncbi:uncharacterized protein IWZ02DRAFT_15235 [Phyllosticta citriasiana]|uniref:uncharacterized protein n=1 Tax=Phyllosticta citriasiana TaxID=595635 RepID=UPI0030FD2DBE